LSQPDNSISFHHVACFSIRKSNITLVFDPHNGVSMGFPEPTIKNADIVLCSHSHYDHNNGKVLVSKTDTFQLEEKEGYFEFNGVQIHGTQVKHGDFINCGYCVVYTVKFPDGFVLIHGGDIGFILDQQELSSINCFGRPDIVILPIGGFYCLNAKEAIETSKKLNPKLTSIMCHFNYGPLVNLEDFKPMTDEKPFLTMAGKNAEIIKENLIDLKRRFKKYTIFSGKF
jgi:L-ascorbate metabolism protein UlaG (beta-lactamase superfamily)